MIVIMIHFFSISARIGWVALVMVSFRYVGVSVQVLPVYVQNLHDSDLHLKSESGDDQSYQHIPLIFVAQGST